MYGAEPWYNDLRYNDIPGLTIGMSLTECKILPVITITSISLTIGSTNIVNKYNKTNFYKFYYINSNYELFLTCFKDIE